MGDKSKIEWTEATWNPVVGCAKVSEGCRNCYAMRVAHRLAGMGQERYKNLTVLRQSGVEWNGTVRTVPQALEIPLRWKRPRMIFVNSMSDLFHPDIPYEYIDQVFAVMALCRRHTLQVLTKQPEMMLKYMERVKALGDEWETSLSMPTKTKVTGIKLPLPNVWLGVSVEDQKTADERIPILLKVPAAVRWLSMEPLLGPVDITSIRRTTAGYMRPLDGRFNRIDWVVVGGESGPKARPMHPDWVRSLRDQCAAAGVPFFFKQWGDVREYGSALPGSPWIEAGHNIQEKKGGRILDGRTWDEMPEVKE